MMQLRPDRWLTRLARSGSASPTPAPPQYQGYLDQRSTHHVAGWVRDTNDAAARVTFEVVVADAGGERVLARGVADRPSDVLREVGVGDGTYAFAATFDPPLDVRTRDAVLVRPVGAPALEHAPALSARRPDARPPRFVGYVDERSERHLAGWVWNEADPAERLGFEVRRGDQVLARGVADRPSATLAKLGIGQAAYAFHVILPTPVADPTALQVWVADTHVVVPPAPRLKTRYEPISHVAMDIVNNCNLRCPFCTFDYAGTRTTRFMDDATFQSALRLLPYVTQGNFWLSCLHEATIHPELLRFIDMVPREHRDRLMYTTNLAKRMPDAYFAQLGDSGMDHVNISVESLRPEIYERLRKGARFRIFAENWAKLLDACRTGSAPPRLRYNMMAYRANLHELPSLVQLLLDEKLASQVEIRYTFDEPHIPDAFRTAEYLRRDEWDWLVAQLGHHDPERVLLILPPPEAMIEAPAPRSPEASAAPGARPSTGAKYPLHMRIEWSGQVIVYNEEIGPDGVPQHMHHLATMIQDVADPERMIAGLLDR